MNFPRVRSIKSILYYLTYKVKFPYTVGEQANIIVQFTATSQFPNVIGVTDCTYVVRASWTLTVSLPLLDTRCWDLTLCETKERPAFKAKRLEQRNSAKTALVPRESHLSVNLGKI